MIHAFAQLTDAPESSYWGYMTSGGTEGNLYGVFTARELLPNGIFYCSEVTFSLQRLLSSLGVRSQIVRAHSDGCMDIDALRQALAQGRSEPAIILANIGTTLHGAVDDVPGIHQVLSELSIEDYYIHADAALSGMILPFVDNPPLWNFSAGIDSLSISLHTMVGAPLPCGVVLTDEGRLCRFTTMRNHQSRLASTILASRNAVTPLFIWYAFQTVGLSGFRARVERCIETADYAIDRLAQIGCAAWRHPYSVTVVFDKPSDALTRHWQLFSDDKFAHIIAMPHIKRSQIDRFVDDMRAESSAPAALALEHNA